jgi:hypothetical protein
MAPIKFNSLRDASAVAGRVIVENPAVQRVQAPETPVNEVAAVAS